MIKKILKIVFFSIVAAGCSSNNSRPDWVDMPYQNYNQKHYLTAVGQGDNKEQASSRALANMAKFFVVNIADNSSDLSQASIAKTAYETSNQISRHIKTQTKCSLEGVEIEQSWLSPSKEYFALAVLDKKVAVLRLTQAIKSADQTTQKLLVYSSTQAPNIIKKLQALSKAQVEQSKREGLNQQLLLISENNIKPQISSSEIAAQIRGELAFLKVSAQAQNEQAQHFLQSAISELGITINQDSKLQLKAELDTFAPFEQQGWHWQRGSFQLSLLNETQTISQKRWEFKISAQQPKLLATRLQDQLEANVADYLFELLTLDLEI